MMNDRPDDRYIHSFVKAHFNFFFFHFVVVVSVFHVTYKCWISKVCYYYL